MNECFVPLISKVPGFVAYYWVDAGGGVMISTSVFQDQFGAEESNKRAADFVRENLASLLPMRPQITDTQLWKISRYGIKEKPVSRGNNGFASLI